MNVDDVVDWINWKTDITATSTKNIFDEVDGAYVRWLSGNREYIAGDMTRTRDRFEILLNSDDSSDAETLMDALQDIKDLPVVTEDFEDALGASWTKTNSDRNNGASYTGDWAYKLTGVGGESSLLYTLPIVDTVSHISFYTKWVTDIHLARFFINGIGGAGFYIDTNTNIQWYDGSSLEDLNVDMTEDTWYKFELQRIDIEAETFDLLVNNTMLKEDADFSPASETSFTGFIWNVGSHGDQNVWIDDISITYENDVFFKPVILMDELPKSPITDNYNWMFSIEMSRLE